MRRDGLSWQELEDAPPLDLDRCPHCDSKSCAGCCWQAEVDDHDEPPLNVIDVIPGGELL